MPDYIFVDRPEEILPWFDNHERIGVDTEFMRERTFFSQLCLIQVSSAKEIVCVDPLTKVNLSDFWKRFCGQKWVLHSARQDIEVIYQTSGRMPEAIFDTQVAAALLGYQPQMGYGNLVQELFRVELKKSHTRANWAARPLPGEYLDYAAEDVEYLLPAHEVLTDRLERKGRFGWAESDSALMLDPALYEIDPGSAISRVKGAAKLTGKRRAAASALAEWRETLALAKDLPRQWVLRDRVLLAIAYAMPATISDLSRIQDLPAKILSRSGTEILKVVSDGTASGSDYRPPGAPSEAQKSLLKDMQRIVADCARDLELAAETIASKKELSAAVISGSYQSRVFAGWRRELVGDRLKSML